MQRPSTLIFEANCINRKAMSELPFIYLLAATRIGRHYFVSQNSSKLDRLDLYFSLECLLKFSIQHQQVVMDRYTTNGSHGFISANTNGHQTNGTSNSHSNDIYSNGRICHDYSIDGNITPPPIAIVGMALRLPGGVNSPDRFWDLLINKKDGRTRVPGSRYNVEAFHGTRARTGEVSSKHGYFLEDSLEQLDASFFSMSKSEITLLDPQQKLLLEVVYECMESAGQSDWRGGKVGCYVGVFGEDWLDLGNKDTQSSGMYRILGMGDFAISNRISYEYDLKGPR